MSAFDIPARTKVVCACADGVRVCDILGWQENVQLYVVLFLLKLVPTSMLVHVQLLQSTTQTTHTEELKCNRELVIYKNYEDIQMLLSCSQANSSSSHMAWEQGLYDPAIH